MDQMLAVGEGGSVSFDGRTVTVTRNGLWNALSQMSGTRTLRLDEIAHVRLVTAGVVKGHGFIQFVRADDPTRDMSLQSYGRRDDYNAARLDDYAVMFARKAEEDFVAIKRVVEIALGLADDDASAAPRIDYLRKSDPAMPKIGSQSDVTEPDTQSLPAPSTPSATASEQESSGQAASSWRRVPTPSQETQPLGLVDQLRELGKLREEGLLTDEEFAAAKAKLLAS